MPLGRDGKPCNAKEERHWQTLNEAIERSSWTSDSGCRISAVLGGSGYCVLDLDHVIHLRSGAIGPDGARFIGEAGSYSEYSPSATGALVWLRVDGGHRNLRLPGVEVKASGIITVTGHQLVDLPIEDGG